jgi:hypothetical protein
MQLCVDVCVCACVRACACALACVCAGTLWRSTGRKSHAALQAWTKVLQVLKRNLSILCISFFFDFLSNGESHLALQAWTPKSFGVLFKTSGFCLGFRVQHPTYMHTYMGDASPHAPDTTHKRFPPAPFPSGHSDNSTAKKGNSVFEVQMLTHTQTHTQTAARRRRATPFLRSKCSLSKWLPQV